MTKENRQYLLVGTFVILATILLFAIWLWFTSSNHQKYNVFITTFSEPVDGLTISSPIKYSGVEVGKVKEVELDYKDPRNIIVYLNILPNIKINKLTTASLKSIGVTGISYVELTLPQGANLNDNIIPKDNEPYPVITSKPSFLYNLSEQAKNVATNINDISTQTIKVLSDKNIKEFSHIIANFNQITTVIATNNKSISNTLQDLSVIATNLKNSTQHLDKTITNINTLSLSLTKTSNNTNNLINNFNNNTLTSVNNLLLPNLNQAIIEIAQTTGQLTQLLQTLNKNPSALIKGIDSQKLGPGE